MWRWFNSLLRILPFGELEFVERRLLWDEDASDNEPVEDHSDALSLSWEEEGEAGIRLFVVELELRIRDGLEVVEVEVEVEVEIVVVVVVEFEIKPLFLFVPAEVFLLFLLLFIGGRLM